MGNPIASSWGSSPTDVWAVGAAGTLLHYDGTAWSPALDPDGFANDLFAVQGAAANDVWAVGSAGTVLHYDGSAWKTVGGSGNCDYKSVWVGSASDVWIGGAGPTVNSACTFASTTGGLGSLAHWDGTRFTAANLPPSPRTPIGSAVVGLWGSSTTDVWAVETDLSGTIYHYDGTTWSASMATNRLLGIWGTSASDVWAGTEGAGLLHWNGSAWSAALNTSGATYYATTGSGARDVWVIENVGNPQLKHWDGSTWSSATNSPTDMQALWAAGASSLWSLGGCGDLSHWNGTAWATSSTGFRDNLTSVWASGPSDVWALSPGVYGSNKVYHYNGGAWSDATPMQLAPFSNNEALAVWGASATDVWLVGRSASTGLVLRGSAGAWTAVNPGTGNEQFWAVHGTSAKDIWLAGSNAAGTAAIYHYDGTSYTALTLPAGAGPLHAVRAMSAADAWAAGESDTILHWDGTAWTAATPPEISNLTLSGLWGASANDVWAVGTDGSGLNRPAALHWDGTSWTQSMSAGSWLEAVMGTASNDVWAVGSHSDTWHWDGTTWTAFRPTTSWLEALWVAGPNDVRAVGRCGAIVHRVP